MKSSSIRLAIASLSLVSAAAAAPFLAVGDGAELFVTGTLGVRADDNIYTVSKGTSDTIFDINPGLELTFGKDGQLKGTVTLVEAFANYSSNSKLNTNLFSGDAGAGFDDGKMKIDASIGYHELNQNTAEVRGLTRRDEFSIQGKGEVEISEKTSIGGGYSFKHTKYKAPGYADMDDSRLPINFYYKMSEKLSLSAGYEYHNQQVTIGEDATDHFFNVGARGEFTPMLSGTVRVGMTRRSLTRTGDETMFGLDGSLSYELTPKTKLQLTASNAPDTSPQGAQKKDLSLGGSVSSDISDQWKANAGINFKSSKYTTRTDDFIDSSIGATYTWNAYVKVTGSYTYRNNSSPLAAGEFTENVFTLATNVRY